jgi:hypothetical protein
MPNSTDATTLEPSGFIINSLDYSKILNIAFWALWLIIIYSLLIWLVGFGFIIERTKESYFIDFLLLVFSFIY